MHTVNNLLKSMLLVRIIMCTYALDAGFNPDCVFTLEQFYPSYICLTMTDNDNRTLTAV